MKKILTPEQLEMRAKKNKKIIKFGCLPIFILCVFLIVVFNFTDDKKATSTKNNTNIDSIVSVVKKSKDFEIKEVYYNKKDSSFNIAITNKDNVIKEHDYSILYFDNLFHLDKIEEIEGVYLYEYKNGKSFKNDDYNEYLTCESKNLANRIKKFEDSGYEYSIKSYLEENVDDPTGLEIINKIVLGENADGTFSVKVTFRSKNAFGTLIIHTVTCDVDMDGNGKNIVFEN